MQGVESLQKRPAGSPERGFFSRRCCRPPVGGRRFRCGLGRHRLRCCHRLWFPPFVKNTKDGAPAVSSRAHEGSRAWATRPRVQLENDRTMIIKMNPPIPRRPTPMSLAIHRTRSSSSGRSGCARFAHRTMTTGRRMANTAPTTISIGNMASAICPKKTSSITQVTPCPTATPVAPTLLPRLGRAQRGRVAKGRGELCRAATA